MPQRKEINLNNLNISYLEWNNSASSEPILMLHGMADHSLVWSRLGEYLSSQNPHYHLIAPDLRGHGNSSKPDTGYFYQDYSADLEALYQYFQWEKVHIIAHSWSAKLACLWANQFPDKCKSLVLVDPFFINSIPSFFQVTFPLLYNVLPFLTLMQSFPDYESAKKVAQGLKQYQGWTSWQEEIFNYSMEQKDDRTWTSKFAIPARDEIFEDVMAQQGLTKKLDIPSLLVLPKQGLNRFSWQIKPFKNYLTNLRIAQVSGNHWAFMVEADDFNSRVADFLASL
jgi:pimeloyl-ACP methyl ester carboxylesterase